MSLKYEKAKSEIVKRINALSPVHSLHNVFRDFTSLSAYTISNRVDRLQYEDREAQYMNIIRKYSRKEANLFAEMLALTTMGLEDRAGDVLGEVYMELEISNRTAGQFFTSYDVSKLMAEMTVEGTLEEMKVNGSITVNEPAVGGGVTIIAMAEALKERGLNYQKCMKVVCNDIDADLVKMCYVQLSLLGIDAIVARGDTITQKFDDFWYTPIHILNKAQELKEQRTKSMVEKMQQITKRMDHIAIPAAELQDPVQLSLF